MIDFKNFKLNDVESLIKECKGYVDLVRIAMILIALIRVKAL